MKPRSSHISEINYDDTTRNLRVRFKNGSEYEYRDVDYEAAQRFQGARSLGRHFHTFIKPKFRAKKV